MQNLVMSIVSSLQLIVFQIGFDKCHKATDTVAEIANEQRHSKIVEGY